MLKPRYLALHFEQKHQAASNGWVGALRIVDPEDFVVGLDEEKQLQDFEGILSCLA